MTYHDVDVYIESIEGGLRGKAFRCEVEWNFPELMFSPVNDLGTVYNLMHIVVGQLVLTGMEMPAVEVEELAKMDSGTLAEIRIIDSLNRKILETEGRKVKIVRKAQGFERAFNITADPNYPTANADRKILLKTVSFEIFGVF